MIKLLIFAALLSSCSSTAEDLEAAIAVCKNNGGLHSYKMDLLPVAICKNGAKFNNPRESLKGAKE